MSLRKLQSVVLLGKNKEATTTVAPVRSVQKRAKDILKYGLMPLCVPLRHARLEYRWNTASGCWDVISAVAPNRMEGDESRPKTSDY